MEEKIISVKGVPTAIRIEGEGDPFLILHGWGVGKSSWENIQNILSKHFKVIVFDFPGFGSSGPIPSAWDVQKFSDFVLELAEKLNLEKFYLLGQSFGGRVAVKLAAKHPQKIKKLILVDAAGIKPKKTAGKKLCNSLAKIFKKFEWLPGYNLFKKAFYCIILGKTDYLEAKGTKKGSYLKVVEEDLTPYLEKIDVETLVVWGKKDKITPLQDAYLMNRKIKNSKLKLIDCGHRPHRELPDILTKIIIEFIENERD